MVFYIRFYGAQGYILIFLIYFLVLVGVDNSYDLLMYTLNTLSYMGIAELLSLCSWTSRSVVFPLV